MLFYKNLDIEYLCTIIGDLCSMPVRIYEGRQQIFYHCIVRLPKDPVLLYLDEIIPLQDSVGYYITEQFHYYGFIHFDDKKLIIGPSMHGSSTRQELRLLAFRADVPAEDTEAFIEGMQNIFTMPLESIIQMLCAINYILNGEKKSLCDVILHDETADSADFTIMHQDNALSSAEINQDTLHNTYDIEQQLMHMVQNGETQALKKWLSSSPAVRGGVLADNQLRQMKNTFIVTCAGASRAAIAGGLSVNTSFTLSDSYIQECELLTDFGRISSLQYQMLLDFTEHMERLRKGQAPSPLVLKVTDYVQSHISEVITTEALAKDLYMSRSGLSRKFKEESGQPLAEFIQQEKIREAERLLRYTNKTLASVSLYLGFSSQSHFSRAFRKYTELTPGEYRKRYARG